MATTNFNERPMIKIPYNDWDPNNISISMPWKKQKNFCCEIFYDYILNDGTNISAPLSIEMPKNMSMFQINKTCPYCKLEILCRVDLKCEMSKKYEFLLRDIYNKCLLYMSDKEIFMEYVRFKYVEASGYLNYPISVLYEDSTNSDLFLSSCIASCMDGGDVPKTSRFYHNQSEIVNFGKNFCYIENIENKSIITISEIFIRLDMNAKIVTRLRSTDITKIIPKYIYVLKILYIKECIIKMLGDFMII
jgi:hypothetical protein